MSRRSLRFCLVILFATFSQLPLGRAADADVDAGRLMTQAMKDFSANRFLKAEAGLKTAGAVCRSGSCSNGTIAKMWGYLGVVYASGLEDAERGSACFLQMLTLDPSRVPDERFSDEATLAAFKTALSAVEAEKASAEAAKQQRIAAAQAEKQRVEEAQQARVKEHQARLAELKRQKLQAEQREAEEDRLEAQHQAEELAALREAERKQRCDVEELMSLEDAGWVEQALGFPIPLFVKVPKLPSDTMKVAKVSVDYFEPGSDQARHMTLKPMAGGYGGYLPCAASSKPGQLRYVIRVVNDCGTEIGSAGSDEEPRSIKLKPAVDYSQPHLPNELPPETCTRGEQRMTCEFDDDCPGEGAVCAAGACTAPRPKIPQRERIEIRRNRISVTGLMEFAPISSAAACSPSALSGGQYSCFREDGSQLEDNPQSPGSFSTLGVGSLHLSLGYDRVLGSRWLVGGRAGLTLLGHPERRDGERVQPVHLLARGAVYFGNEPFASARTRLYAALSFGLAESAGRVDGVSVRSQERGLEAVRVWQKGGNLFAGAGLGLEIPISDNGAITGELGARQYFPTSLTAFGPSLGYVHGL